MSKFWNFEELDQLHIELTNGCNAACPMCVRFMNSSPLTRPDLKIQQITLDKFKEPGSMVLFHGFVNHEVTPVTKGIRKTIAIFIGGPKWR